MILSPSKYSGRTWLRGILDRQGLTADGTRDYSVDEARGLYFQKEMEHAERAFNMELLKLAQQLKNQAFSEGEAMKKESKKEAKKVKKAPKKAREIASRENEIIQLFDDKKEIPDTLILEELENIGRWISSEIKGLSSQV
jgi:hypothetical protein